MQSAQRFLASVNLLLNDDQADGYTIQFFNQMPNSRKQQSEPPTKTDAAAMVKVQTIAWPSGAITWSLQTRLSGASFETRRYGAQSRFTWCRW